MDPKPSRPRGLRRRILSWLLISGSLLAIPVAFSALNAQSVPELRYGQFKKKLVAHEIKSVKVGPAWISGELNKTRPDGQSFRFRTSRLGMEADPELISLLEKHIPNSNYEAESGPSPLQTVMFPAVLLALVVITFWVVSQRPGGIGSAMAFAKSRPKVYSKDERRVTFDDVAGNDEAVAELSEVVEFLRTPEKYHAIGGRIPKGVLLAGPP
ncbi:ATP-dependent metallopeptidase FtsH/Yme1/Tma family protein, partial [Singulisphaera rosea]